MGQGTNRPVRGAGERKQGVLSSRFGLSFLGLVSRRDVCVSLYSGGNGRNFWLLVPSASEQGTRAEAVRKSAPGNRLPPGRVFGLCRGGASMPI